MMLAAGAASGMTATVTPSTPSPVHVGTPVTFAASSPDAAAGTLWYRFRVRRPGAEYQMIRDFGPDSALTWTDSAHEGVFDMEVTIRNVDTGDVASAVLPYLFQSLVVGGQPAVTPTANPLVFLFSAPPCPAGSRMRVAFAPGSLAIRTARKQAAETGTTQYTPFHNCTPALSMNFYLAGMQAESSYVARAIVDTGTDIVSGAEVEFTTGKVSAALYSDTIQTPYVGTSSDPVLLGSPLGGHPVAHDLAGNVIWYGPDNLGMVTRPVAGGDLWSIVEVYGADPTHQLLNRFDLAGTLVVGTNAARVNEQLKALGKRQITGFHHEARSIAGGRVVALAGVEQVLTDVQGPGPVDVLGDMILVLDKNLNVVWTWDAFDNLDPHRMAVLGETCPSACPPIQLAKSANDWTHGNAVQETPDGNLLYSTRHQDWLVKISYDGGMGDGHILWRLGKDGDFTMKSSDPYPWFSHQHDGNVVSSDGTRLMVFDDGNTRVAAMGGGHSRGQELKLDEQSLTATPLLNVDLGVYAIAVGSAQHLRNGDAHFDAGFVQENNTIDSYSYEVDRTGKINYVAHQNAILYRTFRMSDLYTPN